MIEINLLPVEMRKKQTPKFAMPNVFNRAFILPLVGGILALHGLLILLVAYQRIDLANVGHRVELLKEATKETTRKKVESKANAERLGQMESLTERKFSWARVLNVLSDSVPKGMWLRRFAVTEETRTVAPDKQDKPAQGSKKRTSLPAEQKVKMLKLEGSVLGSGQETATIGRFIKALKDDRSFVAVFDEVEFFNITQRKIKSFDVYDFSIFCVFKKEKL